MAELKLAIAVYWIAPMMTTTMRTITPMALRVGDTPFLGGTAGPVAAGLCSSDIGTLQRWFGGRDAADDAGGRLARDHPAEGATSNGIRRADPTPRLGPSPGASS
jgi:hypothetical protein